ncbi:hypothetical protein ACF05T_34070 [Streptomyces lateritius]|uniref:Uncharacterized protein n=1 Tax=Streptomyces lateritius TaxID=67313 RepID=A0ABW6YMD8_9ACTN
MSMPPLKALNAPLLALRVFSVEFAHLSAPCLSVSTVYPDLLELSFHDDLGGFEAWRDALGLTPESVSYHEQGTHTRVLTAETDYAGARLRLTGYGRIPALTQGRAS